MKELARKVYYWILKLLPDKLVINLENLRTYHKLINNKEKIIYFGEKIQWLKLYGNLEKYSNYVDKYKVREYIRKTIGEEYLIPLINVYNNTNEIDYTKLPNEFVMKLNHGSGYNLIIKDLQKENTDKINKQLEKWLKEDYYKIKKEYQYKNVKKKIICEKLIQDASGDLLDYKFFFFYYKTEFVKVDFERFKEHKVNFYDKNWNLLNIKEKGWENYKKNCEKPKNFDEMLKVAEKLAKKFQFVRVDLYNVDGKIYFGELTFTPASGKHPFIPLEEDKKIAERIKI